MMLVVSVLVMALAQPTFDTVGDRLDSFDEHLAIAVERAVNKHPAVASAKVAAQASGAELRVARWQRFPTFSVETLVHERANKIAEAQAVIDQPLWTGGRVAGGIRRAGARQSAAIAGYDEVVLTTALLTAETFLEFHRWHQRAGALKAGCDLHRQMVSTMERRVAQEISPASDLALARTRSLQIEQQLIHAESQQRSLLVRLRDLVGDEDFDAGDYPPVSPTWPEFTDAQLIDEILNHSPRLKRLRFEAEAAKAEAQVARAALYPQLSLQYSYDDTYKHRLGILLKAQTTGGLSQFAAADASALRAQSSELQIAAGELQLRDQAFSMLREYEAARNRLSNTAMASNFANQVMDSYFRQFANSRRSWLDVMNAVREVTFAQIDDINVQIDLRLNLVRLLLMSSRWTPTAEQDDQS